MVQSTRCMARWRYVLASLAAAAALVALPAIASAAPEWDLRITKTNAGDPTNAPVLLGSAITYGITVDNLTVGGAAVPPGEFTVVDNGVQLVRTGGDTDGDGWLGEFEVWTFGTASGPVTLPAASCAPVVNTAAIVQIDPDKEINPADNSATVTTPVRCDTDLSITKTSASQSYVPGGTIVYTVTVTNNGPNAVPLSQIAVSDPTVQLTLTAPNPPPAALAPGATLTYTGSRLVAPGTCGQITNTATVALTGGPLTDTDPSNNSSTRVVNSTCTELPDVSISKTSDKQAYGPGETARYTVVVTNTGMVAVPVSRIQVADPKVALTLTAPSPAPASLAPGATLTYTGTRALTTAECGTLRNTATVSLAGDSTPGNNTSTTTATVVCNPDLSITKTSNRARYRVGETIRYTVVVTNNGQTAVPFSNIQVSDPNVNLVLVGAAPATLAPGASLTYRAAKLVSVGDCPGRVTNTATVALTPGSPPETDTSDNSATRNVSVLTPCIETAQTPRITIVKSGPRRTISGQVIVWSIVVRNPSRVPLRNVVLRDTLPAGIALSGRARGATLSGRTLTWRISRLAPRASRTLRFRTLISLRTSGRRCNAVTVTARGGALTVRGRSLHCIRNTQRVPPVPPIVTG